MPSSFPSLSRKLCLVICKASYNFSIFITWYQFQPSSHLFSGAKNKSCILKLRNDYSSRVLNKFNHHFFYVTFVLFPFSAYNMDNLILSKESLS